MTSSNKVTFSTGIISTALIGGLTTLEKHQKIDAFYAELGTIFIPLFVALFIWLFNRVLHRIEPYSDEQILERARCKNTINELKKELKGTPTGEIKTTLENQLKKQYEKLSEIALKAIK